jgi:hypothetical protein
MEGSEVFTSAKATFWTAPRRNQAQDVSDSWGQDRDEVLGRELAKVCGCTPIRGRTLSALIRLPRTG